MLSYHRCISPTQVGTEDTYLDNLELRQAQKDLLRRARLLTRNALRAAFRRETAAFVGDETPIAPNFFTQGSWAYKTINRPSHVPPQQTDLDDGCYLPMAFVRGTSPKRAATWFFSVADRALETLVKEQGWLGYDNTKRNCCRLIIDRENHVDVPLYAIRNSLFVEMKKSLTEDRQAAYADAVASGAEDEYTFSWSQVTNEDVLLAERSGIWTPSNPMEVKDWVLSASDQAGSQLATTWRSMKGWRDQNFEVGGPSSIALMVLIEEDFEEVPGRVDLAVRAAARSVRERIEKAIPAPWNREEDLNRLTMETRRNVAAKAKELEEELDYCIQGSLANAPVYLKRLREHFGVHFSKDSARVKEVSAHEVVHAYAAAPAVFPPFKGDNRSA